MTAIPIYDATAPVACTLGAEERPARIARLERIRRHLARVDRTEHGLLLHLPSDPELEAELRRFATDEKRCCPFWGFAVHATGEALTLRWEAPPEASELLERLHGYLAGDAPLTDLSRLL